MSSLQWLLIVFGRLSWQQRKCPKQQSFHLLVPVRFRPVVYACSVEYSPEVAMRSLNTWAVLPPSKWL